MDLKELPRAVRAELRGLTAELAEIVGAHLLMAGKLIDTDPELAYAHAEAARRRASRLAVTREATGETAYAAGEYAVALNEFRALRRMNGGTDYLAAMADCERALGHPEKALKLVKEGINANPEFAERVELRLVEAGCRIDMGQIDEAVRLLKAELESAAGRGSRIARARLRYGFADVLEQNGQTNAAERWFAAAAVLDTDGLTDADERVARLQGVVLEIDEDALVGDEPEEEGFDSAASGSAQPAEGEDGSAQPAEGEDGSAQPEEEGFDSAASGSAQPAESEGGSAQPTEVDAASIEAEVAELLGEDEE